MLDLVQEIFNKVKIYELGRDEAIKKLENMISFCNEADDNQLIALAIIELEK